MVNTAMTLGEISTLLDAELKGDPTIVITGLATLQAAGEGQLGFLANPNYAKFLGQTRASAVILAEEIADQCPTNVLIMANPYLGYARLSHYFSREPAPEPGVHASAIVDPSARIAPSASIGPRAVVGAEAVVGEGVIIEAGAVIGARCVIGDNSRLYANSTLYHDVTTGVRCTIHAGAVVGSDGFGFANHQSEWVKIAQLGGVRLGDDVEVGANTTIDRGALDDTVIGNGVKLDNLVQIAHNVIIGDHSAIAGCAGVAGSTTLGRHCVVGGGTCISGHLEIGDQVHFTGMTMATHSIYEPGIYSSGTGVEPNRKWRKNVIRFRQLDDMTRRLKGLEKRLAALTNDNDDFSG
jgi:UDP-3-O-[3-hydroxymyristoyl] glucosamine N-acyltransferase